MTTNIVLFYEREIKIFGNVGDLTSFNDICNPNLTNSDGKKKAYHGQVPVLSRMWFSRFRSQ